jgi:tetratricopeptide (TPR) repeat protein
LLFDRSEKANETLVLRFPENVEYQVSLAWSDNAWGNLSYYFDRKAEAREYFRKAITRMKSLVERFPKERRYRSHLLGMLLYCPDVELREPLRAVTEAQQSLANGEGAGQWSELAYAQTLAGQHTEALQTFEKARGGPSIEPKIELVEAIIRWNLGQKEEAQRLYKRSIQVIDQSANKFWYSLQYRFFRAEYDARMGVDPLPLFTPKPK